MSVNKRLRSILLVTVLLFVAVFLAGCGVPQGEIDLNRPPGWWEAIVVYPIAKSLMFLHAQLARVGISYSYGWAIIIFTLFIKVITLPLTLKQLQSTRATQELQPKLRELQEKYGKDRQKLAEEQMKLYKEAGVNPMGGCLPLLIQLPILWGLYQALYVLANPSVRELQNAGFYWIPDLSFPDLATGTRWLSEAFSSRNWGMLFAYASLPLIMTVSQVLLQKMSSPPKGPKGGVDPQQQMMGQMMMFMPLMFGYITLGLPSGLTLYWTASNVLSMIQQYFITGWGALVDWFPFLKARPKKVSVVGETPAPPPTTTAVASEPAPQAKPPKRRQRRK